jgi:hypothetical protein
MAVTTTLCEFALTFPSAHLGRLETAFSRSTQERSVAELGLNSRINLRASSAGMEQKVRTKLF